jgi:ammonium transporter, Amt family
LYGVLRALLAIIFTKICDAAGSLIVTDSAEVSVLYSPGDIAWTLASMALVWIMIPGVGYFYSGLLRRKNALSMIYLGMMTIAVVSFQVRAFFPSLFNSI